ncbi:D-3-phosphoglycerate dehydrogenase [Arthrobacter sp. V4I6]|uniref:C-terminal binding protein n=1 Tax=unclassified Arthrobacter TaxID=235627 RepID=UPI00278AA341|nr:MULTISPECIES: C-terminal binding protein [unclassified Arthrobacter]MDQ0821537.1 D-3-phosphoglycerate dehydrogenase [Arthrobacter sp. V1I7]MDQ0855802.1 D-3-phosphoglycerate dehydrogenase [Arthrobacter sp. V4I6]
MRIVKTDGVLETYDADRAEFAGLDITFDEITSLTEAELISNCEGASALLVLREPITARVLDALPQLRVIGRFGVGLDSIDVQAATNRGIVVTNVPDSNITEVATHAVALALALTRRLHRYDRSIRSGQWDFEGPGAGVRRVSTQVFGLIGFGKIGQRVAASAKAIGFEVWAHDPFMSDDAISSHGVRPASFSDLIAGADVVSIHVPLIETTRNLIGAAELAKFKAGANLINVSRGGLVDEVALAAAVAGGHLAGAGLDTFAVEPLAPNNPLRDLENVILSPHAAHYSAESYAETRLKAFRDVARVLGGKTPFYAVNAVN